MATASDVFTQLGLVKWWGNITNPYNPPTEMGTDFNAGGFGAPVGAITGGKVVYVGAPYASDPAHSSLNYVVQVLTPDGRLVHYQHLWKANVQVGQTVNTGDVVGTQGGCPIGNFGTPGGVTNGCPGGRFDDWTSGSHIEVREASSYNPSGGVWNQAWANPMTAFLQLAGGAATVVLGAPTSSDSSTSGGSLDWQTQLKQEGIKVGVFLLALILLLFGFYVMFKPQADSLLKKGMGTAVKAAVI